MGRGGGWVGGSGWRDRVGGGQVGCERRIEVFVKIQKKTFFFFFWGGGGLGRRVGLWGHVDVNEELKFFMENSQQKRGGRKGGQVGGRVGGGVRVDVNE